MKNEQFCEQKADFLQISISWQNSLLPNGHVNPNLSFLSS